MIPRDFITGWRAHAPWIQDAQVEQDLVISRAELEANLIGELDDAVFAADLGPLLRPGLRWDLAAAARTVLDQLVATLPGEPWKGPTGI